MYYVSVQKTALKWALWNAVDRNCVKRAALRGPFDFAEFGLSKRIRKADKRTNAGGRRARWQRTKEMNEQK